MYALLSPLLCLPIVEIIGFAVIGGKIGLLRSILWIIGSTWLGFYLLQSRGKSALARAQRGENDDVFVVQDLFDGFCILIASLLLIFPGFISDFIAIPFLLSPLRHYIFERIRNDPAHPARKFTQSRQPKTGQPPPRVETIEGEYKTLDDTE